MNPTLIGWVGELSNTLNNGLAGTVNEAQHLDENIPRFSVVTANNILYTAESLVLSHLLFVVCH